MNECYEHTLDANFNKALTLCSESYTKEQLLCFLKDGNLPEKQFAALEINSIDSQEEADILMSNLTGCDGKIREAVALKIFQLMQGNPESREFFAKLPAKTYADATIDINAIGT